MRSNVCCIQPCLMSDVHASCCDCDFPQHGISEASECQQRQGLRRGWQAQLCTKVQGQKQYAQPMVIMHTVSGQMPADSLWHDYRP